MITNTVVQPRKQLGNEISKLLDLEASYTHIAFVSAFVGLRTILRLRERLLAHVASGASLHLTIGIDLGGTSREVMEELLAWNCVTFVFHNTIARATFHPKVYLFQGTASATLFVGSNNLTDGGFYTNYEATVRYDFDFPADSAEYERLIAPLTPFLLPQDGTAIRLDAELIRTLVARGELPSEAEARQRRGEQDRVRGGEEIPASPFVPEYPPLPPLLPKNVRSAEHIRPPELVVGQMMPLPTAIHHPVGVLVWRKQLTKSDASDVPKGTHPKALVVLTQAHFESHPGQLINQTTYFRNLFRDEYWEPEDGGHADQEHAFVRMRIFIRGQDYGIRNFEISHKPSGEAGQGNSPTSFRWGPEFNQIIRQLNLTGAIFSLFETADEGTVFLIDITAT